MNLADDTDHIKREALQIQAALVKQRIGEDEIALHQICLALKGLYSLWDEAGDNAEKRMNAEARMHLSLVE